MKRIFEKFKNPPLWLALIFYFLTICFATASIIMAVLNISEIYAYVIYGCAGTVLAYSVYTIVKIAPNFKRRVTEKIKSISFTRKLISEYGFRTLITTVGTTAINLAFAIFNIVLAIWRHSFWYGAIAAYNLILMAMRGDTMLSRHKNKHASFIRCALAFFGLSFFLSIFMLMMIGNNISFSYPGWTVFAFAAYAFFKITMAIISLVKTRKENYTIKAIKYIGLADASFSILSLQTALLHQFSEGEDYMYFNAITGAVVCALTLALGVFMLIQSRRKNGRKE